jgi:hypothetical protein
VIVTTGVVQMNVRSSGRTPKVAAATPTRRGASNKRSASRANAAGGGAANGASGGASGADGGHAFVPGIPVPTAESAAQSLLMLFGAASEKEE